MNSIVRTVLIGLGAFFLAVSLIARFWAPSQAQKTPLNTDAVVVASGPAKILNSATGQIEDATLRATRTLRVDSSVSGKKNIVMSETLCIVKVIGDTPPCVDANDSQHRLVQFTTDRRAEDAHTSEAVNDAKYNANVNGDTSVKHVGLGYKFPFNSKKKTYQFFDTTVNKPFPAVYSGTEKVSGLKTYKYVVTIEKENTNLIPGLPVTYDDTRTIWVEPRTGVIVKGSEHQVQTLTSGQVALETTLVFDEHGGIDSQVKLAKDGIKKLQALTVTLPLIGLLLALVSFGGAYFMYTRRGDSGSGSSGNESARHQPQLTS